MNIKYYFKAYALVLLLSIYCYEKSEYGLQFTIVDSRNTDPTGITITSSGYIARDMGFPLHSILLSLPEGHELEGQVITVPTRIEAPTFLTNLCRIKSDSTSSQTRQGQSDFLLQLVWFYFIFLIYSGSDLI